MFGYNRVKWFIHEVLCYILHLNQKVFSFENYKSIFFQEGKKELLLVKLFFGYYQIYHKVNCGV